MGGVICILCQFSFMAVISLGSQRQHKANAMLRVIQSGLSLGFGELALIPGWIWRAGSHPVFNTISCKPRGRRSIKSLPISPNAFSHPHQPKPLGLLLSHEWRKQAIPYQSCLLGMNNLSQQMVYSNKSSHIWLSEQNKTSLMNSLIVMER